MSGDRVGLIEGVGGNVASVRGALRRLGVDPVPVRTPDALHACDRVVFPGVGAFPSVMRLVREGGFDDALIDYAASGRWLLGICVGMQVLADAGDEHQHTGGLGLVPGRVVRLLGEGVRLPHIGWSAAVGAGTLFDEGAAAVFYFVHSYHLVPTASADAASHTTHGEQFVSAVERGNVLGVQFHPEKSQLSGLRLLERFLEAR